MIRFVIKTLCMGAIVISLAEAQSGDADWLIPVPLNNKTVPSTGPVTSTPSLGRPVFPYYYEYEAGGDYGSGSSIIDVDPYKNVAPKPLSNPPCLLPEQNLQVHDRDQRHYDLNERRALSVYDLLSEKIQVAGYLAMSEHMNKTKSKLELVQFLGGCRMPLAGELIFLIFNAKEIVPCVDGVTRLWRETFNCTDTETTLTFNRECRARVHISNFAPWKPFYINCKSPEFFALPWKKI